MYSFKSAVNYYDSWDLVKDQPKLYEIELIERRLM